MHLCGKCRAERDWETDATVQWQIKTNLARPDGDAMKARCTECTRPGNPPTPTYIRNPLFTMCKKCAERLQKCQYCRASTETSEALAEAERREELIDLFTLGMKAYGFTVMVAAFREHAAALGVADVEAAIVSAKSVHLDGRLDRPIWKKVLGGNIYRHPRFCEGCRAPNGRGICRAERCGHLTIGLEASYCALCATDERSCERCGTSYE